MRGRFPKIPSTARSATTTQICQGTFLTELSLWHSPMAVSDPVPAEFIVSSFPAKVLLDVSSVRKEVESRANGVLRQKPVARPAPSYII